jgi:hypothetical protein
MKRRGAAKRSAVPLAGITLLLCLVCSILMFVVFSSVAAAKKSRDAGGGTAAPTLGAPVEEAPSSTPTGTKGRVHGGKAKAEDPPTSAEDGSAGAEEGPAGKERRKAARREARHAKRDSAPSNGTPDATGSETSVEPALVQQTQSKDKRHKERERERRRARRESRRGKETGGEEESEGGSQGASPEAPARAGVGSTATSVTTAPQATAATSSLPAVVGVSASRSSKTAGRHAPAKAAVKQVSPALAGALALPVASPSTAPTHLRAAATTTEIFASAPAKPTRGGLPLVHTVTHFIGVVPSIVIVVFAALVALALALAVSSRLSSRRAERLARQRRELLDDVGLLQAALLPELPESLATVGTTAAYQPASGPAAGGDFYDLFALEDGRLAVIVGDVSGHGRKALPHTTLVRFTLRAYLEAGMTPRGALQIAAPALERQLGGSFATVVIGIYDPSRRTLSYACAGHPHPVFDGEGLQPITACSAPPIGVGWPTGTRETVVSIPGGARVCFYTDGVIEAKIAGELFGVERVQRIVSQMSSQDGAAELLARVSYESDEHSDDMASCMLELSGDANPPSILLEEVEVHRHEVHGSRLRRFLAAGGLSALEIEGALAQVDTAVQRDGSVVLRLSFSGARTRIELAHNNVARMRITARSRAGASEVAV